MHRRDAAAGAPSHRISKAFSPYERDRTLDAAFAGSMPPLAGAMDTETVPDAVLPVTSREKRNTEHCGSDVSVASHACTVSAGDVAVLHATADLTAQGHHCDCCDGDAAVGCHCEVTRPNASDVAGECRAHEQRVRQWGRQWWRRVAKLRLRWLCRTRTAPHGCDGDAATTPLQSVHRTHRMQ
jgi:hypothetical protein